MTSGEAWGGRSSRTGRQAFSLFVSGTRFWSMVVLLASAASLPGQQSPGSQDGRFETPEQMRAALQELPKPDLEREEPAVREQLERNRAVLDELLLDPSTPQETLAEVFGRLGRLYLLYDQNFVGPPALRNATLLAPEDPRWHYYLAVLQAFEGAPEEAEAEFRRALELNSDDTASHVRLGDLLRDRGELDEAEAHYDRVLELRPESAAATAGLGQIAAARGNPERAVELLERALELQPEADSLYHPLGMAYRALGERDKALEAMKKNKHRRVAIHDPLMDDLALSNLSMEARFQAGSDAMRRGDMEAAAEYFRAYLEVRPEDEVAWHNLGIALLAMGSFEEGIAMLRQAVALKEDYRGGHFSLASALSDEGRFEEALEHYRRAHELDPVEPVIHADWATLMAKLGRIDEALAELEALIESNPDTAYGRLKYGTVLALAGRTEEAAPELEKLSESGALSNMGRAEAHYHLAVMARNRGETQVAKEHLERALELDDSSAEANQALAQMLAQQGEFARAADLFERALEETPWDVRLHVSRGLALMLGEDYPRARLALQESVAAQPDNLELKHLLARLLAACPDDRVRDGERAVRLADQVVAARLTIEHAETMAMALAEVGRFDEAAELQSRVLEQISRRSGESSGEYLAATARLEDYRAGRPVRAPWRNG